jgi:hypothetical protein
MVCIQYVQSLTLSAGQAYFARVLDIDNHQPKEVMLDCFYALHVINLLLISVLALLLLNGAEIEIEGYEITRKDKIGRDAVLILLILGSAGWTFGRVYDVPIMKRIGDGKKRSGDGRSNTSCCLNRVQLWGITCFCHFDSAEDVTMKSMI